MRTLYCIRLRGKSVNAIDEATKEVDSYVKNIKHKPKKGDMFMTLQDKLDQEKRKIKIESIAKLMQNGNMTFDAACDLLEVPEENKKRYLELMNWYNSKTDELL